MMRSKDLMEAVKRGETPETLAKKYGRTEEDLIKDIRNLYGADHSKKAEQIISDLKANTKIKRKRPQPQTTPVNPTPEEPSTDTADVSEEDMLETEQKEPQETNERIARLVALQAEKEELSKEAVEIEKKHASVKSIRHNHFNRFRDLEHKVDELSDMLKELEDERDSELATINKLGEEMNKFTEQYRPVRKRLNKIEEEINDLSTVTLCAANDGLIEAPDNPEFVVDVTGYVSVKAEIAEREECLDLTMRQITTLAKLIKVAEKAERFNLICDSEELETAFWAIWNNR